MAMKNLLFGLVAVVFLVGCQNVKTEETQETTEKNNTEKAAGGEQVGLRMNSEAINDIIQSIPSPLEVTSLIQSIGTEYKKESLNNPDLVDGYNTNFKRALNLGVYSTDLGFANIYSKNQEVIDYLNSVKKLADGLSIGRFFDYNTIKKLATNNENLDSLLQMTTTNFEKINFYLGQQKRENLSILILTGGWIEANHLTTMVYKESKNEQLRDKIGEQKLVLEKILIVLDVYKQKAGFPELIAQLKELKSVYDRVEITIEQAPPEMKVVGDEIVIETKDKTIINITEADVDEIASILKSIRTSIVQ
jgi:hypothetical protein